MAKENIKKTETEPTKKKYKILADSISSSLFSGKKDDEVELFDSVAEKFEGLIELIP